MDYGYVTNSKISTKTFKETQNCIDYWIKNNINQYICVCNTHSLVTALKDSLFKEVLDSSGLCVPDGMPLVFALRRLGFKKQERVDGPNLMLSLCEKAEKEKYKIFLYGGKEETLRKLQKKIARDYPKAIIVDSYSPPFRDLSEKENEEVCNRINITNPDIIFVSLGCPKQEIWMFNNRENVEGVMIGVGAAFDFIVGDIKRPPLFFQKIGLEWAFRLISEPKRLFKRYAINNTSFVVNYIKYYKNDYKKTLENRKNIYY